ncbi:hypothetical protein L585_10790 [Pantoea ananatis BRT175]|nr:hypothetical protein L585_10790 [Pantoea ananatis BRT175]
MEDAQSPGMSHLNFFIRLHDYLQTKLTLPNES